MLKYLLYLLRWVVLAIPGALFFNKVKQIFGIEDVYVAMMMSQAMMGAMVYFTDRLIFASGRVPIPFEVRRQVVCADCGCVGKCYRVAGTRCCDKTSTPEAALFRCEACTIKRAQLTLVENYLNRMYLKGTSLLSGPINRRLLTAT